MTASEIFAWMGGTFDPIHSAHLILARHVAETAGLRCVQFMPAACPPHKAGPVADGDARLEMLRLAVAGEDRLAVSDLEIRRPAGAPSYTIDTIDQLRRQQPARPLAMVIGADMLADLPNWHQAPQVVEAIDFYVLARPGWQEQFASAFDAIGVCFGPRHAERIRDGVVEAPLLEISSTMIRERLAAGRSVRFLVPDPVAAYIRDHRLYRRED
jgi:nicotinate-nucleotide adenylyltransferase